MAKRDDNRGAQPPQIDTPSTPESGQEEAPKAESAAGRQVQVPELMLRNLIWRLRLARSVVTTAAGALAHQNADRDGEVAFVLQKLVVDTLTSQIETVNRVLGLHECD